MPAPFIGEQFTFTQPDGTPLTVRGWGNQNHAVFETLNGYTVVRDPVSGFFQYADVTPDGDDLVPTGARPRFVQPATLGLRPGVRISTAAAKVKATESPLPVGNTRWAQRRREAREALRMSAAMPGIALAPPQRETVGDFVGLCLLVQFPDLPGTITRQEVEDFCNKPGYNGFGNNGSVRDYYDDISAGRLKYQNIVAPYYTAKHPFSYYTNEAVPQPVRARELIKEALAYHKAHGFDFTRLTVDNAQYVYAVNVFYAGTRVNGWAKGLWPHSHYLQTPYPLAPGKSAHDYQITDMTKELTLGTFCHENGHMICDFPDLYDYGNESAGIGAWCLMCAGSHLSKNPPHVGGYLKFKAGWAQELTKVAAGLAGTAIAASNKFFIHRKSGSEYFIIENRFKSGRDALLPGSGLAIWHVDELGDNQNEGMTPAKHYECALMQADGRNDLETNPRNIGDATDLFAKGSNDHFGTGTTPHSKWWDGTPSNLDISAIGAAGAAMAFKGNA